MKQLLKKGAEASIYLVNNKIVKERESKRYRLRELDQEIRKTRTRKEARLLKDGCINLPKLYEISEEPAKIVMEYIVGDLLKDVFDKLNKEEKVKLCIGIGKQIAQLHQKNIIHGDITTSNLIMRNSEIYFIDFGLGFSSNKVEDKAVDLYLLKQSLKAMHKNYEESFLAILEGYKINKNFEEVVERLNKVEKRGRYKLSN